MVPEPVLLHECSLAVAHATARPSGWSKMHCVLLQGKIAKWWMPDDVMFVKEIPHTATGKIYKLKLRQQFEKFKFAPDSKL